MKTWPNWVDLVIITLFIIMCYRGFARGFLAELLYLGGAVSATALSVNYSGMAANWIRQWWSWNPTVITFLVFVALLLVLVVVVHLIVRFITGLIKWERINWVFETSGVGLGGVRALWWGRLLFLVLTSSGVSYLQASVEERSVSGPYLLPRSREVLEGVTNRFPGLQYRPTTLVPPMISPPGRRTTGARRIAPFAYGEHRQVVG